MHEKCLRKLQDTIGCACIGDKLSETQSTDRTVLRNIVSILYLNHLIDKELHDTYIDKLFGCDMASPANKKAKSRKSRRLISRK